MDNRVNGKSFVDGRRTLLGDVAVHAGTRERDGMEDNQFCVYMCGGNFCARSIGLLASLIDRLSR